MSKITPQNVISTIEGALEVAPGTLDGDTRADQVRSWDSVGQLSILVALDKLFDGKIANIREMAEADSTSKILALLKQHSLL